MGLRPGDLKDMVKNIFEVDSFASKMGDDADIVVVSFSVNEEQAANDLVDFIEKGYNFVLDADATAGEVDNNIYKVFVEIERDRNINDNIMELLDGVGKLSLVETFKFRYHKSFTSRAADLGTLSEMIPIDPDSYDPDLYFSSGTSGQTSLEQTPKPTPNPTRLRAGVGGLITGL